LVRTGSRFDEVESFAEAAGKEVGCGDGPGSARISMMR
jgi:hypothetical protein